MEEFEIKNQGLIIDEGTISEYDYMLWGESDLSVKLKFKENTNKVKHFYNQWAQYRTRNWCVLYSACWVISDLLWYKFSDKELLEIIDSAEKDYWWKENYWMYLHKGIDCVRNWWNTKFPNQKLISFRVEVWSEDFAYAIKKWYTIQVGYRTTTEYYKDSQDDWIISKDNFIWFKWGHAVRCSFPDSKSITIDDNYFWQKKFNTYVNNKIKELRKNWVFFNWWYLFLKQDIMIFNDVPETHPFADNIKWAKDKWITSGYPDGSFKPDQPISRWEFVTMLRRAEEQK